MAFIHVPLPALCMTRWPVRFAVTSQNNVGARKETKVVSDTNPLRRVKKIQVQSLNHLGAELSLLAPDYSGHERLQAETLDLRVY
jgi:hypothetical protein